MSHGYSAQVPLDFVLRGTLSTGETVGLSLIKDPSGQQAAYVIRLLILRNLVETLESQIVQLLEQFQT